MSAVGLNFLESMQMNRRLAALMIGSSGLSSATARASSRPSTGALPLSTVVLKLEQAGFSPVVEVEFDDGLWEIEAFKDNRKRRLKVDPTNGQITSDRLDD